MTSPTDTAWTQIGRVPFDDLQDSLAQAAELLGYPAAVLGDRDELEQDYRRE